MLFELFKKCRFWKDADRIGPDIPGTHWRLHLPSTMLSLCKKKFKAFHETAEFRAGAYAIGCSKISIGRRVVIRPGCMLFADPRENGQGITIEDDVIIGSGVHLYAINHRFDDPVVPIIDQGHSDSQEIVIKKGSWIGAASVILPGVTIGENAVVGAGSIVTKSIPSRVLAAGNPATIIRRLGE
jgi:acetyltransferase-like isoleucine patch superfamily enzyme